MAGEHEDRSVVSPGPGGAPLPQIAEAYGTPAYVYDLDSMRAELRALREGFEGASHLVAYAVKANAAGPVVRALGHEGSGADVVSGAELLVALGCGIPPEQILYSGVAKQDGEIDRAISVGESGIAAVQVESLEEIARVEARARTLGRKARVSIRINPTIDLTGATHAHIATGHDSAKFGVHRRDAETAVKLAESALHLSLVGMATHVGSQFLSAAPYLEGARVLFDLVQGMRDAGRLRSLTFVNTGGGFGVDYTGDAAVAVRRPRPADFVRAVRAEQRARDLGDLMLCVEPGRSLVAPFGLLLSRVIQTKVTASARWLMIDAGMNDLMRPALYQAKHRVVPVGPPSSGETASWRVVGPVCESSDDFGEHILPIDPPARVALLDAGAYGYTMANRYNGRQLPVEVFVSGGRVVGATSRATVESWAEERIGIRG